MDWASLEKGQLAWGLEGKSCGPTSVALDHKILQSTSVPHSTPRDKSKDTTSFNQCFGTHHQRHQNHHKTHPKTKSQTSLDKQEPKNKKKIREIDRRQRRERLVATSGGFAGVL